MKEKLNKLFLIFYVWTMGLFGGVIFLLLKILKRVEIEGYEKWKSLPLLLKKDLRLLAVSNHPSLWEPMVLPFLFSRWYLFFPSTTPFSTPDWNNYYNKWWYFPWRPVSIPIVREKIKEGTATEEGRRIQERRRKSLKKLFQKIRERRIIILFPEGGRTFKGEEFKILKNGKIIIERDRERVKKESLKIRRFREEISTFLKRVQIILPIWTEVGEGIIPKVKIKLGEPLKNISSLEDLENILLKTGAI